MCVGGGGGGDFMTGAAFNMDWGGAHPSTAVDLPLVRWPAYTYLYYMHDETREEETE